MFYEYEHVQNQARKPEVVLVKLKMAKQVALLLRVVQNAELSARVGESGCSVELADVHVGNVLKLVQIRLRSRLNHKRLLVTTLLSYSLQ